MKTLQLETLGLKVYFMLLAGVYFLLIGSPSLYLDAIAPTGELSLIGHVTFVTFLIGLLGLMGVQGKRVDLTLSLRQLCRIKVLGIVLLAVFVMLLCDQLGLHWLQAMSEETTANEQALAEEAKRLPLYVTILTSVILAPIGEEFVFRGLLYKKLFGLNWLGLVASSVLFALVHMPTNLPSWFIYMSSGLIFAYAYKKTDNLGVSILIHLVNNALATLLPLLQNAGGV